MKVAKTPHAIFTDDVVEGTCVLIRKIQKEGRDPRDFIYLTTDHVPPSMRDSYSEGVTGSVMLHNPNGRIVIAVDLAAQIAAGRLLDAAAAHDAAGEG